MKRLLLAVLLGYVPAAMAFGALATALHLSMGIIVGFSVFIYSGALQSTMLGLIILNPSFPLVISIGLAINLRHMLYGPHLEAARRDWRPWHRWLLSGLLTDELYAVGLDPSISPREFSIIGVSLYAGWILATLAGALGAHLAPTRWLVAFGLALPALFVALLIPRLNSRPDLAAAATAIGLALLGRFMHWPEAYFLVPILLGATAGWWFRQKLREA